MSILQRGSNIKDIIFSKVSSPSVIDTYDTFSSNDAINDKPQESKPVLCSKCNSPGAFIIINNKLFCQKCAYEEGK